MSPCRSASLLTLASSQLLANLWRHECGRVFGDKLTNNKDKAAYSKALDGLTVEAFGDAVADHCKGDFYMVNFMRDDEVDDDGVVTGEAPKVSVPSPACSHLLNETALVQMQHLLDHAAPRCVLARQCGTRAGTACSN